MPEKIHPLGEDPNEPRFHAQTITSRGIFAMSERQESGKTRRPIRCECGREFTNRLSYTNHGRKCPQEQAWQAGYFRRVEQENRDRMRAASTTSTKGETQS